MKSTIVIYEHECATGKAAAKHIAYHLGAQTTCTRCISQAMMATIDNFVLCVSTSWAADGSAPDAWQRALGELTAGGLAGKSFAVYLDSDSDSGTPLHTEALCSALRGGGGRVIAVEKWLRQEAGIDEWISAVSPSL